MTVAETERLVLRHLTAGDAGAMDAIFCDAEVMRCSDGVQTPEWVRAWIATMIDECYLMWGFGFWAIIEKVSRKAIGCCGLSRFRNRCDSDEAELGFRLARPYWDRGFATEVALAARDHGPNTLRLARIVAIIDPENTASVRVAQKIGMGFEREIMFANHTHPDHLYVVQQRTPP